jgi:hypothetical protein
MNNKFDELTKNMAQSVTRRAVLKKFGLGLAGMALACFGLANKAKAQTSCLPNNYACTQDSDCCSGYCKSYWVWGPSWSSNKKVKVRVQLCANK